MKRNNVFTNSLLGTTIQDSGKRERIIYGILIYVMIYLNFYILF